MSACLRLMLLGWPKQMDTGWTTPIDAHWLDGYVCQADGAQLYSSPTLFREFQGWCELFLTDFQSL